MHNATTFLIPEAIASTSWCEISAAGSPGVRPAAQLEQHGRQTYGSIFSEISLDSGPRVIPTTSAPNRSRASISAGRSNCGPTHWATTMPLGDVSCTVEIALLHVFEASLLKIEVRSA